jgi:ribosome-binding factor A
MQRKSYPRHERVSRALLREIAKFIEAGNVKDDRLNTTISIVDVELNPSLSSARVYFSILDPDFEDDIGTQAAIAAALNEHSGLIRGNAARQIHLRYAPKLYFIYTDSLSQSVNLIGLIDSVVDKDQRRHKDSNIETEADYESVEDEVETDS